MAETQRLLQKDIRTKRCIEFSPSVEKTSAQIHAAGQHRRSLDFNVVDDHEKLPVSHLYLQIFSIAIHLKRPLRYSIYIAMYTCKIIPYKYFVKTVIG